MRRFPFLVSRHVLAILLAVNLALLGTSIYLGLKSAGQMREIVKEDFNQQQLVLARHTAGLLEQDINFLKRELSTLNFSPSIQYLEPLTWANRMRATLASVREEGVVEIFRLDAAGQSHLPGGWPRPGPHHLRRLQGRPLPGMGRQSGEQGPGLCQPRFHPGP